jgi:predicted metal-dependent HD superfamily phosphohydrolase
VTPDPDIDAAVTQLMDGSQLPLPPEQWQAVKEHYATPPRVYHDLRHVADVVRHYDDVAAHVGWRQPAEVWLAALYHDAIYVAGRSDNEARSAALAMAEITRWLPDAGIDAARVLHLIELTARHGTLDIGDVDGEAGLFLDCDMAILAAPADEFDAYDRAIAEEYRGAVDDADFRAGRRRFLGHLLRRQRIYLSDHFHQRWDAAARANLGRVLAVEPNLRDPASER